MEPGSEFRSVTPKAVTLASTWEDALVQHPLLCSRLISHLTDPPVACVFLPESSFSWASAALLHPAKTTTTTKNDRAVWENAGTPSE